MTPNSETASIEEILTVGFLYGIQSDSLPYDEVQHRVAGFKHTKGFKEATQAITQAMLDALPEKRIGAPLDSEYETGNELDAYADGYNKAVSEMETAIKKIGGE